jgi:hypothetical protein
MRVRVRVGKVDTKRAQAKAVIARQKALTATTEAARLDTEPYVPMVTGALRRTAETESIPTKGLLVYGNGAVPYASAQYYGLPGKTWPGTVMHWFDVAKRQHGAKWVRINKQEYARHFGG